MTTRLNFAFKVFDHFFFIVGTSCQLLHLCGLGLLDQGKPLDFLLKVLSVLFFNVCLELKKILSFFQFLGKARLLLLDPLNFLLNLSFLVTFEALRRLLVNEL